MEEPHIQFTSAVQQGPLKILHYILPIYIYIYVPPHTHTAVSCHPLSCTPGMCSGFKEALQQPATAALLEQLTELTAL